MSYVLATVGAVVLGTCTVRAIGKDDPLSIVANLLGIVVSVALLAVAGAVQL